MLAPSAVPSCDSAHHARLGRWLGWTARLATGIGALLLFRFAAAMDRAWTERHLLPDILVPSDWLMGIVQVERFILLAAALALLLSIVPRRRKTPPRKMLRWVGIATAVLLAVPASELAMQFVTGRKGQAWTPSDEPLRQADPLLGWRFIPARRVIDPEFPSRPRYVIDAHGYRVENTAPNKAAPTILFAGESIMFGKGLNWHDTVAGRIRQRSGMQSANLAVTAYSAGQTFLRLKRELPGFRRPVAVVILFAPTLLIRDLDRNRPWIDRAGQWHPAERSWYLSRLGRVLFPYRSAAAIDDAVATDRRLLRADVAMAHARGAQPLVVVPIYQPEPARDRALRAAIFDGAAIPHVIVPLDRHWRLLPDFHPDARAHAAMADAIWGKIDVAVQKDREKAAGP